MDFDMLDDFENVEMSYVSFLSKGYIARNKNIFEKIKLTSFSKFILKSCTYGTPIFKIGSSGKKLLVLSGIHGNELPPQIANVCLLNKLIIKDLNHTLFFIPFASPKSTMNNERTFNAMDLNRSAHINDSLSNLIIKKIDELVLKHTRRSRLSVGEKEELRKELFYSVRKLDILQVLLDDDEITEIMVNGANHIFYEKIPLTNQNYML